MTEEDDGRDDSMTIDETNARETAVRKLHDAVCDFCSNPEDYPGCYVRRYALELWDTAVRNTCHSLADAIEVEKHRR